MAAGEGADRVVEVRLQFEEREYVALCHLAAHYSHQRLFFVLLILAGLFVLAGFVGELTQTAVAVVDLFVAGVIVDVGIVGPRRRFRSNPDLSSTYEYSFSASGVSWSLGETHGSIRWTAFERLVETKDAYAVMYPKGKLGMFLPKRAFQDPDDEETFRRLIQDSLGSPG